jgi:hypothetical protein
MDCFASEAVLSREMADPSAQGQPGHPGRADDAPGRNQTEALGRRVEIEPRRTAIGTGSPDVAVDLHSAHQRQIDHHAALADAVFGGVVPTSAHGDLQRVRPGEGKGPPHVADIETTHDHGRPTVDQGVEAAARRTEPFVCGGEHGAANRSPQLGQAVTGAGRIDRFTHVGNTSHPGPAPGVCTEGPARMARTPR